jgi:hypothetical protein
MMGQAATELDEGALSAVAEALSQITGPVTTAIGNRAGTTIRLAPPDAQKVAKNQIRFAVGQAEESGLTLAGSFVRHLLLNTRADPGSYLAGIGRVDSSALRRTAGRYFGRTESVAVSVVPFKDGRK